MTTNAVYNKFGTPVTFKDANGTVTFTLKDGVDLGNGQVSNVYDAGVAPRPILYKWEARIKWVNAPTLGDVVRIYAYDTETSGNADVSGDGDVTPETKFGNYKLLGQVICTVAADQYFYGTGICALPGRYITLGVWNASGTKDLNATSEACVITLTPMYPDVQAAA